MPKTLEMQIDPKRVFEHTMRFLEETIGQRLTKNDVAYLETYMGLYGQGCRQEGRAQQARVHQPTKNENA